MIDRLSYRNIDVPAQFSQVASDYLAQKYYSASRVPSRLEKVEENSFPSFLCGGPRAMKAALSDPLLQTNNFWFGRWIAKGSVF